MHRTRVKHTPDLRKDSDANRMIVAFLLTRRSEVFTWDFRATASNNGEWRLLIDETRYRHAVGGALMDERNTG